MEFSVTFFLESMIEIELLSVAQQTIQALQNCSINKITWITKAIYTKFLFLFWTFSMQCMISSTYLLHPTLYKKIRFFVDNNISLKCPAFKDACFKIVYLSSAKIITYFLGCKKGCKIFYSMQKLSLAIHKVSEAYLIIFSKSSRNQSLYEKMSLDKEGKNF